MIDTSDQQTDAKWSDATSLSHFLHQLSQLLGEDEGWDLVSEHFVISHAIFPCFGQY